MKHTARMLLIPEDVYRSLLSNTAGTSAPIASNDDNGAALPTATPMGQTVKQVASISDEKQASLMNDDERLIHYHQQFKRYKKLLTDAEERPARVSVTALPESAKSLVREAIEEATIQTKQKQSHGSPSAHSTSKQRRTKPVSNRQPYPTKKSSSNLSTLVADSGEEIGRLPSSSSSSSTSYHTDELPGPEQVVVPIEQTAQSMSEPLTAAAARAITAAAVPSTSASTSERPDVERRLQEAKQQARTYFDKKTR